MGMLANGKWIEKDLVVTAGAYTRNRSRYDEAIGHAFLEQLTSSPDRFHLLVSKSCPWSHRIHVLWVLKHLEEYVELHIVGEPRTEGYSVNGGNKWTIPGTNTPIVYLHQLYSFADPTYTGRSTIPVLWDSVSKKIVSNESKRLARFFDQVTHTEAQQNLFAPENLRVEIDSWNTVLYEKLCNAVYRCGFAQSKQAQNDAVADIEWMLKKLEKHFAKNRYLLGHTITESDWMLFSTLVRYDICYQNLFHCSSEPLVSYPNLWSYTRELYSWPQIADTVDFDVIFSNALKYDVGQDIEGDVPSLDWNCPHDRDRLGPGYVSRRDGSEQLIRIT